MHEKFEIAQVLEHIEVNVLWLCGFGLCRVCFLVDSDSLGRRLRVEGRKEARKKHDTPSEQATTQRAELRV